MKQRKKRWDLIVIGVIAFVAVIMFAVLYGTQKKGANVVIRINGKQTASYPLNKDRVVTLHPDDDETNTITIKNGTVKMTEANCKDHICEHHPAISKVGESIICLPHKLVVAIEDQSGKDSKSPDTIAQ